MISSEDLYIKWRESLPPMDFGDEENCLRIGFKAGYNHCRIAMIFEAQERAERKRVEELEGCEEVAIEVSPSEVVKKSQ